MISTNHIENGHVDKNDLAITGVSCRLPKSNNIDEFRENLENSVDMISEEDSRFPAGAYGTPKRWGKLPTYKKFDALFFQVTGKQAELMDPQLRMLLETSYEAITDAGFTTGELSGKKIGVFIGASASEAHNEMTEDWDEIQGPEMTGCMFSMFANRISYFFNWTGPSFCQDTACSSSLLALDNAMQSIRSDRCDAAIVGGSNLILNPKGTIQFKKLGMVGNNGQCRSFDSDTQGYCRSEGIVSLFLQKSQDARRIYWHPIGSMSNCDGYKRQGISFPSSETQKMLFENLYHEAGVDSNNVEYIECHGTGTEVGDKAETDAITNYFFRKDQQRSKSLLIGSTKSNMGHPEPCSGLSSMCKLIISYQNGIIPRNLHYDNPNQKLTGIVDGKLKVVSEHTDLPSGLVGINNFGFGGANTHVILKQYNSNLEPTPFAKEDGLRLFVHSARTHCGVQNFLNAAIQNQNNLEYLNLLHKTANADSQKNLHRGYTILNGASQDHHITELQEGSQKEIWFCYTGMGAHWSEMGLTLMKESAEFKSSIEKCHSVLQEVDFDLTGTLYEAKFDNVLKSMVCNVSIQISLTDLLQKTFGIMPSGVFGHSTGETVCGYALGCQTLKETVLAAYWRAKVLFDAQNEGAMKQGQMVAGLVDFEKAKLLCSMWRESHPDDIVCVATHNAPGSVTFSGDSHSMNNFVPHINSMGIKTRSVNTNSVAFHSDLLEEVSVKLRQKLETVMGDYRPMPEKWYSTSVPESQWTDKSQRTYNGSYHVKNFISTVLFADIATKFVPKNAVVVEIGPHALLTSQLIKCIGSDATFIKPIVKETESYINILHSIGKMFCSNAPIAIENLLPQVPFPITCKVPFISHLIDWQHEDDFGPSKLSGNSSSSSFDINFKIDLSLDDYQYICGHQIDSKVIFPATGYLDIVRNAFARKFGNLYKNYKLMPVKMENIKLLSATFINAGTPVILSVTILPSTGEFEIRNKEILVVTGSIKVLDTNKFAAVYENLNESYAKPMTNFDMLDNNAFYTELRLRGYEYNGDFSRIKEFNWNKCVIPFENDNFVPFMDMMLQSRLLESQSRSLMLPTRIREILIDPTRHYLQSNQSNELECRFDSRLQTCYTPGIIISGLHCTVTSRKPFATMPTYQEQKFVPLRTEMDTVDEAIQCVFSWLTNLKLTQKSFTITLIDGLESDLKLFNQISSSLDECLKLKPLIKFKVNRTKCTAPNESFIDSSDLNICLGVEDQFMSEKILPLVKKNSFIASFRLQPLSQFDQISVIQSIEIHQDPNMKLKLFYKPSTVAFTLEYVDISKYNDDFGWIDAMKNMFNKDNTIPVLIDQRKCYQGGLSGFVKSLLQEPLFIDKKVVSIICDSEHNLSDNFVKNFPNSTIVVKNGQIGTLHHIKKPVSHTVKTTKAFIDQEKRADLSSFKWFQSKLDFKQNGTVDDGKVMCKVAYAPINFRDIMLATGRLPPDALPVNLDEAETLMGLEFAGYTVEENPKPVIGFLDFEGLATYVNVNRSCIWTVPENWSLVQASTTAIAYLTAYYALVVRGNICKGQSVLIHSGAGAVGTAAIKICLNRGLKVFATVGTDQKRKYLKELFGLKEEQIFSSRSTGFEVKLIEATNGRGVDAVLNSTSGEILQASVRCVAKGGCFLEIGKYDLSQDSKLGMSFFLKNVTFHGILLDALVGQNQRDWILLSEIMTEGLKSGEVIPLPHKVFPIDDIEEAFRYMTKGTHTGKVVLQIAENYQQDVVVDALPKFMIPNSDACIVIGGLGAVGLEVVNWMVQSGARNLYVTSTRGISTSLQKFMVQKWETAGARITIIKNNLKSETSALELVKKCLSECCKINSVICMSGILNDKLFKDLDRDSFQAVFDSKATPALNIDRACRKLCIDLKYFVCFSSVSGAFGNAGQSNYAYANCVLDQLCLDRRNDGLNGISIQWGAIGEVGMYAKLVEKLGDSMVNLGDLLAQPISSIVASLKSLLLNQHECKVVSCRVIKEIDNNSEKIDIIGEICKVLGFKDSNSIPSNATLTELGLVSLGMIEVKGKLEAVTDKEFTTVEVGNLTFKDIHHLLQESNRDEVTDDLSELFQETNSFDSDMWLAKDAFIKLESAFSGHNCEADFSYLFIGPIEGTTQKLKKLALLLDKPVYGIDFTEDLITDTIEGISKSIVKVLQKNLEPSSKLAIVAYSFGSSIGLELSNILRKNETGLKLHKLILIDGSHIFVKAFLQSYIEQNLPTQNDYYSEKWFPVIGFFSFMTNFYQFEIKNLFLKISLESDKKRFLNDIIDLIVAKKKPQFKTALELFTARLLISYHYAPEFVLDDKVLLFRSLKSQNNSIKKLGSVLGLERLIKDPEKNIDVVQLDGTHNSIVEDSKLVEIVAEKITDFTK